jgi:hypothetical protein
MSPDTIAVLSGEVGMNVVMGSAIGALGLLALLLSLGKEEVEEEAAS